MVWIQCDCSLPGAVRAGDDCVLHSSVACRHTMGQWPWQANVSPHVHHDSHVSKHSTSQLSVNVLATDSANSAPSSALALWNLEASTGQE